MKIDLVNRNPNSESHREIQKCLRKRGVKSEYIQPEHLTYSFSGKDVAIYFKKKKYELPDLVMPREMGYEAKCFVETLMDLGVQRYQRWNGSKLTMTRRLALGGVPYLHTVCGNEKTPSLIKGKVVCKPNLHGARGKGSSILNKVTSQGFKYILQPYVKASSVIRVIILDGKALGAHRVVSKNWKANISTGAKSEKIKLDGELKKISEKAAKACKLNFAGVDLVEVDGKYLVLEANSAPGFITFSKTTGVNVGDKLAASLIKVAKNNKRRKA